MLPFVFPIKMLPFFNLQFAWPCLTMSLKMFISSILKLLKIFFRPVPHNTLASLICILVAQFNSICILLPLLLLFVMQLMIIRVLIAMLRFVPFFPSIVYIFIPLVLFPFVIATPLLKFVSTF